MLDNRIEVYNLIKIVDADVNKKCVDDSEKIRKEIMIKLQRTNRVIGIIAHSNLCVSSIELYKIECDMAISFAYLSLRCRENNKLFYYLSKDVNTMTCEKEIEYTNSINAANIVLDDLFNLVIL